MDGEFPKPSEMAVVGFMDYIEIYCKLQGHGGRMRCVCRYKYGYGYMYSLIFILMTQSHFALPPSPNRFP